MYKDQDDDFDRYLHTVNEATRGHESLSAMILIEEVLNHCSDPKELDSEDKFNKLMHNSVDKLKIPNSFIDKDRFLIAFKERINLSRVDWEIALNISVNTAHMGKLKPSIIDLLSEKIPENCGKVLIAEAEKFVPHLRKIVDSHTSSEFTMTTVNPVYFLALERIFENYGNVKILLIDIYEYEFVKDRFDVIVSCPRFGCRTLVKSKSFMSNESEMFALENLSYHLDNLGHLIIVVPSRITFSNRAIDLRNFIQSTYTIKEISELPKGSFTHGDTRICLLDIANIRPGDEDIDIRRYSPDCKRSIQGSTGHLKISDATFVMLSELEEQGDWNINKIFAQQDPDYLEFKESEIRKEFLGNVAQVFRGKAIRENDPSGNFGVVNISNIGTYDINYDELDHFSGEKRKLANYILEDGDVLLPARGTTIRASVFHSQQYPCIASSNIVIIRPNKNLIDSYYLKIFLDSPIGKKLINSSQQGLRVMNISYKDLKQIEVPLPPLNCQKDTSKRYLEEFKIYKEAVNSAKQRWNKAIEEIQKF